MLIEMQAISSPSGAHNLHRVFSSASRSAMARTSSSSAVAVIGSGISGAVCASILARGGISVTIFEMARGPGGRMSQRRETSEDGKELFFDHGAPYFTVEEYNNEVMSVVRSWDAQGLVAEWKEKFGSFDRSSNRFLHFEKEVATKKYVGVPGMNAICKALCHESGVEAKFGVTIAKMEWSQDRSMWSLTGLDGQVVGQFDGVVATDKILSSPKHTAVFGRPPPLDMALSPDLAMKLHDIPVHACFAVMLAFSAPLTSIPVKGFSIMNSGVLSWAFCDSSKPGRNNAPNNSECWVLHSTADYAARIKERTGLKKLSNDILAKVAEELFQEFLASQLDIPRPFFMKAHRWPTSTPAVETIADLPSSSRIADDRNVLQSDEDNEPVDDNIVQEHSMTVALQDNEDEHCVHDSYANNNDVEFEDALSDEEIDENGIQRYAVEEMNLDDIQWANGLDGFSVGQMFETKEALVKCLTDWSIRRSVSFKTIRSNRREYTAICASRSDFDFQQCPWRLHASVSLRIFGSTHFTVKSYNPQHICRITSSAVECKQIISNFICKLILPCIKESLYMTPRTIQDHIKMTYHRTINYYKAWEAKRKAITKLFGDWEHSYVDLPAYLEAIKAILEQCTKYASNLYVKILMNFFEFSGHLGQLSRDFVIVDRC